MKMKNLLAENMVRFRTKNLKEDMNSINLTNRQSLYKKIESGQSVTFDPPLCYAYDKKWLDSKNGGNWLNSYKGIKGNEEYQLQVFSQLYLGDRGITSIDQDGTISTLSSKSFKEKGYTIDTSKRSFVNDLQKQISMIKMYKSKGTGAPE
jgi:hypothetical protein